MKCLLLTVGTNQLPMPLWGFPVGANGKEYAEDTKDLGSIPGSGRSAGEGKGYPLQYSGLENSTDRLVHVVTKSWTQLSYFPEKAMAPHSSTLAWKIPWTEEPGRLQSMGS